ncbi:ArsR family transcriptional regulator [Ferroglobus sp.]|uniref:ArsR family transcriptional regulator n=1 Tax=Ferroglobus sp. TaxID=2614230 RepID=UPI0025BDE6F1|nr:ArsR family transcriptional regulator [Ferroglobus sp.]
MSLEKMFLHEKVVDILLKILEVEKSGKVPYPLKISKEVGSPYSYISKVLSEFEKHALIESEMKGRKRTVKLTEDGRRVAELLQKLKEELKKDFVARRKLAILNSFVQNLNGSNAKEETVLPLLAEVRNLKNTDDVEVREKAESLEKSLMEMLE